MSTDDHYFTAQPASSAEQRPVTVGLAGRTVTLRAASGVFKTTVEDVLIVDGLPTTSQRWLEGWRDIVVLDGRLAVASAPGASGNKLNFIDILPL